MNLTCYVTDYCSLFRGPMMKSTNEIVLMPGWIICKYCNKFDLNFILLIKSPTNLSLVFKQATLNVLVNTDHQKVKLQAWNMLQVALTSTTTIFTKGNLLLSGMVQTTGLLYSCGKMNPIWLQILDLTFSLWNIGRNSKMNSQLGNRYHLGNSWKYINLMTFTSILHSRQTVLC